MQRQQLFGLMALIAVFILFLTTREGSMIPSSSSSLLSPTAPDYSTKSSSYQEPRSKVGKLVFIFGLGGSGTRGVTKLLDSWGCKIDFYELDEALDNSLMHRLNEDTRRIMNLTRSTDYDWEALPEDLQAHLEMRMVEKRKDLPPIVKTINEVRAKEKCVAVKWPRLIYLGPVLQHYFPDANFVHVVRDGRDMVFSNNDRQWREFRKYFLSAQEDDFAEELRKMRFWFLLNLQTKHWLKRKVARKDALLINIESFVLNSDEAVYQELYWTVFGTQPPKNLNKNDIFVEPIGKTEFNATEHYGKYKLVTSAYDIKLVQEIHQMFHTELEEFNYVVKPQSPESESESEPESESQST